MPKKISNDDVNLFRSSIGKIKLIKHDKISAPKRINKCYAIKLKSSNVIEVDNPRDFSTPISELIGSETLLSFIRAGVQPKQFKNLCAGKPLYQAKCDLHNLTRQQAETTLAAFIYHCHQQAYRVVCLVHGKSKRPDDAKPILKNLVNQRLREYSNVLAFCSATAKDGGSGAVYILLKNRH